MNSWKLHLLGDFSIAAPCGEALRLPGKKHQALIAYLATAPERTAPRDRFLDLLWGTRSEGQARQSLRGVLSESNKILVGAAADEDATRESPMSADRTSVSLSKDLIRTDIDDLYAAKQSESIDTMIAFARTRPGEFLQSLKINEQSFQAWRLTEAARYRRAYQDLLHDLLVRLDAVGDRERLVEVADILIELDDADEIAHRALMQYYADQGKQTLALRQYSICKQRLASALGVEPSSLTEQLLADIQSTETAPAKRILTEQESSAVVNPASLGVAVAIRPFVAGGDSTESLEYGIILSEEVVSAIACFKWFRVIPRHESFNSSLTELGLMELSQKFGARYIVEGRLRRTPDPDRGSVFVLTVEMSDAVSNDTVWSERFEISTDDMPYPSDTIARIASRIEVYIRISEIGRVHRLPDDNLSAYECALMALSNMYDLTTTSYEKSEEYFQRGVALSADYSTLHSFWCLWKMFSFGQSWVEDTPAELVFTNSLARRAIRLEPSNSIALAISGHFESYWHHDFAQGMQRFDQALTVNPYSSFAWMLSATTYAYYGEPEEALRRLAKSLDLCPIVSPLEFMYYCAHCIAHNFNRDYEQAKIWGNRTIRENPGFTNGYKLLLVALGNLDQVDEAVPVLREVLRLDPNFNVRDFTAQYPFNRNEDRENFRHGLTRVGVPLVAESGIMRAGGLA